MNRLVASIVWLRPVIPPGFAIGVFLTVLKNWPNFILWLYDQRPSTFVINLMLAPTWLVALTVSLIILVFGIYLDRIITGGRRRFARKIDGLYKLGVKTRNDAFSRRVISKDLREEMQQIRHQLIKSMSHLAPERTITIDTLNFYDVSQHPDCNLANDPDRKFAHEFSEVLVRVQRALEVRDFGG